MREQQGRIAAIAGGLAHASVEDVHDARVAARRLRSLLKTCRPWLDPRRARLYRADLRSFARALAGAREADVCRDLLVELGRHEPTVTPAGFRRLSRKLEERCAAAREELRERIAEPGWAALCHALEHHAADDRLLLLRDADLATMLEVVDEPWHEAVRLMKEEPEGPAELHELRLALKHCRYALEPMADVAPKPAARLLRRLRGAQDAIGEHRDAVLARQWVGSHERSLGRSLLRQLLPLLEGRERALLRKSVSRSGKVLAAYRDWRKAARRAARALREQAKRDRASP